MADERDQLTGIFDHLTADDFKESRGPNHGAEAFEAWVEERLHECRMAWASSDGRLNPVTVIADSHTSILVPALSTETMNEYLERLKQETRRLGATWVFTARRTLVGSYDTTSDDPDIPDATASEAETRTQAAKHGAKLGEGLYFYAVRHEGDVIERKHGMIPNENGRLGDAVMGDADAQSVSFYGDLLA